MVLPRPNLDVKLVNVQVSVLGFGEDKRSNEENNGCARAL